MYLELFLSVAAVALTVFAMQRIKGINHEFAIKTGLLVAFVLVIVFFACFYGERTGLGGFSFKPPFKILSDLIKLKYGHVANRSVLNILLFIPFGYLLSSVVFLKKDYVNWWVVTLAGFAVSLAVEICQLVFKVGVFELDDLVKNTLGAFIGYYIFYRLNLKIIK